MEFSISDHSGPSAHIPVGAFAGAGIICMFPSSFSMRAIPLIHGIPEWTLSSVVYLESVQRTLRAGGVVGDSTRTGVSGTKVCLALSSSF